MNDELYMRRCLELASLGAGFVAPNPMVGAVIVYQDTIIGEGYHQYFGGPHAEVNAIEKVQDKALLKEATIYVSLEPCSHTGKTPPCADLLIRHQFKKVVIGCRDPFSEVNGKGIEKLKQAGISVSCGILENEAKNLNKRFFTFHEKKRPFVLLKWAQTPDGFIDRQRSSPNPVIHRISSPETQSLVHQWRSEEQAILVGKNTIKNDDPSLTVRQVTGRNPLRVVLDKHLELPLSYRVFCDSHPSLILNLHKSEQNSSLEYLRCDDFSAAGILAVLFQKNISSVLIEGGAKVLQSFIDADLWDESYVLIGTNTFGDGLRAPQLPQLPSNCYSFSNNTIFHYFHS